MPTPSLNTLLEFALDAAWQAGRTTLGHFQQSALTAERKYDNSPVTVADRQAEQKLRDLIQARWPDHGIIGEEYGQTGAASRFTWVIDPIDGTKSFVSGVPLYSTLLALLEDGKPVLGIVYEPPLDDMIYATRGGGCFWNGRRIHVSRLAEMKEAILLASDLDGFASRGKTDAWNRLVASTYIQRTWGDAYGYALVATGRAEIMVDPIVALWDIAPLQVILEEAGGTLTDWEGRPGIDTTSVVATNGVLFDDVMKAIHGQA
jgi:histidinol-phosphatase